MSKHNFYRIILSFSVEKGEKRYKFCISNEYECYKTEKDANNHHLAFTTQKISRNLRLEIH